MILLLSIILLGLAAGVHDVKLQALKVNACAHVGQGTCGGKVLANGLHQEEL